MTEETTETPARHGLDRPDLRSDAGTSMSNEAGGSLRKDGAERKPLRGVARLHSMREDVEAAIEEGLTRRQLAERFKVSRYSVSDWLKETGLSMSGTTVKQKRIISLWKTTDLNMAAIARELSCSRTNVRVVLRKAGLVQRTGTIGRPAGSVMGKRLPTFSQAPQQGTA
jgi:predicted DNA-binding protein YlxM (UPF0122 family)